MSLKISLMPHQKEAIEKLKNGSILCGGVGTGKSMTALAYYYKYVCSGVLGSNGNVGILIDPRPLYIITTAKKRDSKDWIREMERFGLQPGGENEVECVIDSWNNVHKYTKVYGAFFIFDEQRVVGSGKWSKSFLKITRRNKWILLSATPGDTWMDYIYVFLANGFYPSKSEFLKEHAVYNPYITKFPKIDRWIGQGKLEKLRRSITVIMKYERKTMRHKKYIKFGYDRNKYEQVVKKRWNPWENKPIENISECCYLMRRVVGSSEERCKQAIWITMSSLKQRAIVFYNYDFELNYLKDTIESIIEELRTSSTTFRNSDDFTIAEWNGHHHDPIPTYGSWIYLVQYNAGAEGWNCTDTDTIIFYSQNYSYKMMEQAAGRIDRLNTPFTDLYYYVFMSEAPIEQAIDRAVKNKKNFNENIYWRQEMNLCDD